MSTAVLACTLPPPPSATCPSALSVLARPEPTAAQRRGQPCCRPGLTALPSPRLPEEARQRRVFEMVEALQEHPRDPSQVLIGYSRGLIVVWDLRGSRVLCHFLSSQVGGALPDPTSHTRPLCQGVGCGRGTAALTQTGPSPFPPLKQLENVCWQRDGRLIVSCHSDGSYCQWPVSADAQQREPSRSCEPYGQCSACLAGAPPCHL